ncbi:MAG: hypothetical protein JHC33_01025, partial [Ignisphaera sp.]|nr:hypothetical protein [Ignisphaera sp.]
IRVGGKKALILDASSTHLGLEAGSNITTGGGNTLLGAMAGVYIGAGSSNTCIGFDAGAAISSGTANICIGYQCMNNVGNPITGGHNIGMGWDTGGNIGTGASSNLAFGSYSLNGGTAGAMSETVAIGYYAGNAFSSNQGIFLGSYAGNYETVTGTLIIDSINRGSQTNGRLNALIYGVVNVTPSSQILSLGGGGKVGIGTIAPTYKLDVQGLNTGDAINTQVGINFNPVLNPTGQTATVLTAAGNLGIGDYRYLITFTTALGETGCQVIGPYTTTSGHQQIQVNIPVATDSRVTGRRIYRTAVNGDDYTATLLTTIANNTTTTYTDNIADATIAANASGYFLTNSTTRYCTVNGSNAMTIDPYGTYLGYLAGDNITSGGRNTLIGYAAGLNMTSGQSNIAIGDSALSMETGGIGNIGIGYNAGAAIRSGTYNTCIGYDSYWDGGGAGVASGDQNTAIGAFALFNINGLSYSNTTAVGYYSGRSAGGDSSIYLGAFAGYYEDASGHTLIIDSLDRTSMALSRSQALIYGLIDPIPANQKLYLGGGGLTTIMGELKISGTGTPATMANAEIQVWDTYTTYLQATLQNLSNGTGASTDYVVTADNGTDSIHYGNFGINSSGWTGSAWGGAGDVYLYSQDSHLWIGTNTTAKTIYLCTGGGAAAQAKLTIADALITSAKPFSITDATASTTSTTGALIVTGGVGIGGAITITGAINKVTITAPATSATLTLITGSTLATSTAASLTLALSSAATTVTTIPSGTHSLAITDAANTFAGVQTFSATSVFTLGHTLTASASVATAGYLGYNSTQLSHEFYANGLKQMNTGTMFTATATGTNGSATAITSILGTTGVGTLALPSSWTLIGKHVRIRAWGTVTTAAAPGTTLITLRWNAGTPVTIVAMNTAITLTASMTSMPFFIEFDMDCRTTTTVMGGGKFCVSSSTTNITAITIPIATTTAATVVAATSYTPQICATNGTASGTIYTCQGWSMEILN